MQRRLGVLLARAVLVIAALGAWVGALAAQPPVRGRAALPVRPAWALADSADADAIVRVVIENGPQATLMALGRDTLLLLPVRQLFAMLEIAITEDVPDKRLLGLVDPARPAAGFDTERGLLLGGALAQPYAREATTWQGGELYAAAALIAQALRVRVDVDQATLSVTFLAVRGLPVIKRLERQRARSAQWRAGGAPPPDVALIDRPARFDGALLDWSLLSPLDNPTNVVSARVTLGLQAYGGGLELTQQQLGSGSFVHGQTSWSWTRAWQENRWVRQVGLGTISVPSRRARSIDGALLTNVPYFRPAEYATSALTGVLPSGWELEVQRYGLPLANLRPDATGTWRFDVPVAYGPNEIELLAFGPGGATRRWRANVVVPFERLPAGRLEYVAAAGACRLDLCDRSATLDVRYGVNDRLTLQGGTTEYGLPGGRQVSNPYALASYAVRENLNVLGEHVAGGYTRAEADYQPTTDFRVTVSAASFDTTLSSVFVNHQRTTSRTDARVFWRPVEEQRGFWFALQLSHEARGAITTATEQLSASYMRGPVRVQGGLILDRTQFRGAASAFARTRTELAVESAVLSPWLWSRGIYGRTSALFDADGSVSQLTALLFNSISRRLRFETGVQWVRGLSTPVMTLQVQVNQPSFQAVSTMQQSGGSVIGGQTFSGTLAYDVRERRLAVGNDLANGRGVGYGGVQVDAFLDVNGNGSHDAGEPPIPNLRLTVGSQAVTTDANGAASVGTLNAYVPTYVEVDTASLPNPMWVVDRPFAGVVVRPNSSARLAVSVRPAGGVIGRLEFPDGSIGPIGAEIEFVHLETRAVRRAVTYSDGSFEAYKLKPGRWEIRPSNSTLRRAQSRAEAVVIDVTPNGAEGFLETVTLQLIPALFVPPPSPVMVLPPMSAWAADTARRLDVPIPARPRRPALASRPAPSALSRATPLRAPLRATPRAAPRPGLGPDARPLRSRAPVPPGARATVPRASVGPDVRAARPRAGAGPDARPSLPRARPGPSAPAFPDARARVAPRASAPRPSVARPAAPSPDRIAPRTAPRIVPRASVGPDVRPAATRARPPVAAPASPDARPSDGHDWAGSRRLDGH